jgi:hypothetical protein
MAKYQEIWDNIDDQNVIAHKDTEENFTIPIDPANRHYQELLIWLQSNTADPQYTQAEIDAMQLAEQQANAESYLASTSALVQSYRDAVAAGTLPPIPEPKYKKILNRRRRAAKIINKTVQKFSTS